MADSAGRAGDRRGHGNHARLSDHSRRDGWLARRLPAVFGDPGRARIVLLLAGVLALNSADIGTIGAAAAQLESNLRISHAQLGLLATASSGVGAIAAVPMGVLADRVNRVRLLVATIVVWVVAMAAGGLAPSYGWLLLSRLLLGAAVAASSPVVTSLTGDFIPPAERAGVLGWILTGEIIGTGIGLLVGGAVSSAFSWRYAFFLLAGASLALAVALWRLLPEPTRVGHTSARQRSEGLVQDAVLAHAVAPANDRILPTDPGRLPVFRAMAYLLRIPTNRLLIEASSIGYFFFAGLRTFAVIFAMRQYHLSQTALVPLIVVIGIASVFGAVLGGRLTDRALARGHTAARIFVPAAGYSGAAILFLPGVSVTSVVIAVLLLALGAGVIARQLGDLGTRFIERRQPGYSPRPTRRWTRPAWTSCRAGCGAAPRACARSCAWRPRRQRRPPSAGSPTCSAERPAGKAMWACATPFWSCSSRCSPMV